VRKRVTPSGVNREKGPRRTVTFPRISEEMKQWSALLEGELNTWPHISTKKMFGFLSFYRKGAIFAALPRTRGLDSPSSLILKFSAMAPRLLKRAEADDRMSTRTRAPGEGWFSFELRSESDLRDALRWLNRAYEASAR